MQLETPIHGTWFQSWAPEIVNPQLRKEIRANRRLWSRIERDLVKAEISTVLEGECDSDEVNQLDRILRCVDEHVFLAIGRAWCSPVLAQNVLGPGRADTPFSFDKQDLQMVLSYRNHLSPNLINAPSTMTEIEEEGRLCLFAWVRQFPSPLAEYGVLRLPRVVGPAEDQTLSVARAKIFEAVISELKLEEVKAT
ncbi:hypothetical protein AAD018_001385 [Aestuariibius insulae]|uniref:hypothetical protein n=1 Tax=Aestuariibius insulae TaxID=2058287 RepID=UPI00345EB03F